jgi:hypothetical protein
MFSLDTDYSLYKLSKPREFVMGWDKNYKKQPVSLDSNNYAQIF